MLAGVTEPTARRPWTVWAVTWLSYATYYFGRKNLSVTKAAIGRALGTHALYGVETAYLAAYAAGQYVSGWLGDRVGARRLVGFGMLAAAGASFAFGLWSAGALFLVTATVNGFAQSTGWPGNVKAMQEWTSVQRPCSRRSRSRSSCSSGPVRARRGPESTPKAWCRLMGLVPMSLFLACAL